MFSEFGDFPAGELRKCIVDFDVIGTSGSQ